ncbi:MAG: hypothetical protein PHE60_06745 [Sulfurospirillaceae bacterium]|nr:hypothetical protein [Sulfurospirillaceae bacterium]
MTYQIKRAFSMVELIFIIVLMGILAKIASSYMPDNRLLSDKHYISMKIKEQQKNAIGYDTFQFGSSQYWSVPTRYSQDFNLTCIESTKEYFESLDREKSYKFTLTFDNNMTICFDSLGRPYGGVPAQLFVSDTDINVTYNSINSRISVLPMSGYVIIK